MLIRDWSSDGCSSDLQARLVPPLAEVEEGLPRQLAMFHRHRLDGDARAADKGFGLAHPFGTELAFDHDRQFDIACNADAAEIGVMDCLGKLWLLRHAIEDRAQTPEERPVGTERVSSCRT